MRKHFWPFYALLIATPLVAADLRQATFTQVIKDVSVVSTGAKATAKAKVNDLFINPDIVQTGPDSLAEMVADDKTVTRIGANTVFAFSAKGREVNLEQGSVLFHSPKGKGGGTIKTKAASASVLGTTIVVTATAGGGFKAIVLEGRGQITLPNGDFRILTAGQVTFVLSGSQRFGPQLNINLSKLVENSRLVQGFERSLPSLPIILAAVQQQLSLIVQGVLVKTDFEIVPGSDGGGGPVIIEKVIEKAIETRVDRLSVAKATDVVLLTPNLTDHPQHLFSELVAVNIPALGVLNFSGFVGNNITVAPTVSQLDFTPFLNQSEFTIGAFGYLDIRSAALQLFATPPLVGTPLLERVTLGGRLGLTIVDNASITASGIGELNFASGDVMRLNNVTFANSECGIGLSAVQLLDLTGGGIQSTLSMTLQGAIVSLTGGSYNVTGDAFVSGTELLTDGAIVGGDTVGFFANTSLDFNTTTVTASSLLDLDSLQDVKIGGGSYSVSGGGGLLDIYAGRDITVTSGAQFEANTVQISAGNNATLTGPVIRGFTTFNLDAVQNLSVASGSFTGVSSSPSVAANLSAGDTLTVNGTAISSVANISLSARTVNLANLNFPNGSTVNLYSQVGQLAANPNTGAASVPGHVNFILNVNYGGNPAQLFVGSTINIGVRP